MEMVGYVGLVSARKNKTLKKNTDVDLINQNWLMVSTPLKNMSSSVGVIIPNRWKVIKFMLFMFQTTNQKISNIAIENSMVPVTTNQWLLTTINHH